MTTWVKLGKQIGNVTIWDDGTTVWDSVPYTVWDVDVNLGIVKQRATSTGTFVKGKQITTTFIKAKQA